MGQFERIRQSNGMGNEILGIAGAGSALES